jgi:formamidopyrimidine-DNA glycosylase
MVVDDPHRHAVVRLDDGSDVAYRDVRRFGTWLLLEPEEVEEYVDARVGREPLGEAYKAKHLAEKLANRRAPVKAAILDQRTVAGVGNIYADEALWRARIHPLTPANELGPHQIQALHRGIRRALEAGIARQGSTLRDYRLPDGSGGSMQEEFRVYGRRDEPCDRCGTPIARTQVAGRTTWFCPACQPEHPA